MNAETFRAIVRVLHAKASAGSKLALAKYTRLMQGWRTARKCVCGCNERLFSLRSTRRNSDFFSNACKMRYRAQQRARMLPPTALLLLLVCSGFGQPVPPPARTLTKPAPELCEATVFLAWQAAEPVWTGTTYRVLWGYAPGRYSDALDAGTNLWATVNGICRSRSCYLTVSATGEDGVEVLSDEVMLPMRLATNYVTATAELLIADNLDGPWKVFATLPQMVLTNYTYTTNAPESAQYFRARVSIRTGKK